MDPEGAPQARTSVTSHYPQYVLEAGLRVLDGRALWLLLSLDHYGWRAHADITSLLLNHSHHADPSDSDQHLIAHRVMGAFASLFQIIDQLWRLVAGIQSHLSGRPFLDGYLSSGYKLDKKISTLLAVTEPEWSRILALPNEAVIGELSAARQPAAAQNKLAKYLARSRELPVLAAKNMREIAELFERPELKQPARKGYSLRDVEDRYRHGMAICYEDCAPDEATWRPVQPKDSTSLTVDPSDDPYAPARSEIVNVLLDPALPDDPAYFAAVPIDPKMQVSLLQSTQHLSSLIRRIVTGFLSTTIQGFATPLAVLDDDPEWTAASSVTTPPIPRPAPPLT